VRLEFRIEGLERVERRFSQARIDAAKRAGFDAALLTLEGEAKQAATEIIYQKPERGYRRTGLYRASLGRGHAQNIRRVQRNEATFGTSVRYARFLEQGTRYMRPRRVLQTAVTRGGGRISQAYARAFIRELRR